MQFKNEALYCNLHYKYLLNNLALEMNKLGKCPRGRAKGTGGAGVAMAPPVFSEEPKRGI